MYKPKPLQHAGMLKKPLELYDPNAYRSRLNKVTIMMPHKNASQFVIGDRNNNMSRTHYKTVNQQMQLKPDFDLTQGSNTGILAAKTRLIHRKQWEY